MTAWSESEAREIVAAHRDLRGPLLPALRALQARFGCVDPRAVAVAADVLNLSRAEVHGVATFYRDLRAAPAGATVVRICRAEACQARGASQVADHATGRLGVEFGATTGDGGVTLDEVFCLGNCARGPSVTVNDRLFGDVTPDRLDALLAGAEVPAAFGARASVSGPVTVYVPGDSSARAAGADAVAVAMGHIGGAGVRIVRNGSRGMAWLEPLVEVATERGRIGFGPVTADDVAELFDAGFLTGDAATHRLCLGPIDEHPWLAAQERVTFARVGVVDPLDPDDFVAHGGLAGLRRALAMTPEEIVAEVADSGLRGRGGAGFPTGIKWRTVLSCPADQKFVCANADEGDSGTFADRMLMEGDPFGVIEGMVIASLAVGAAEGFIYIRSEYPDAVATMDAAVQLAYHRGWLGPSVVGSGRCFDVFVRVGAGAYICGEETAMLESLEGKRGVVRAKPPLPAIEGLFGRPTVVNNVLTLATIPAILTGGASSYQRHGVGRSRGTQVFQLAGNVAYGGIVEMPFGITVGELIGDFGGGTASGRPVRAVQVGGPLGAYLSVRDFDRPMDYEAFAAAGAIVGHGGLVVFDDTVDMAQQARFAMAFCAAESCGKCTPCRVGAVRGVEVIDRILAADGDESRRQNELSLLEDLCELMASASLCAMGGLTPLPVRSAIRDFGEDFSP